MRIALVSDTHLAAAAPAFDRNLRVVRDWVAANGIGHTVHLGDVSADGAEVFSQLAHAQRRLAGWPGTLHILLGNHGIGDNPGAHGHRQVDAERLGRFVQLFGPDRWLVRVGEWTLIGLNAQLCGRGDALDRAQGDWLAGRDVLAISHGMTLRVLRGLLCGGEPFGGVAIADDVPQGSVVDLRGGVETLLDAGSAPFTAPAPPPG